MAMNQSSVVAELCDEQRRLVAAMIGQSLEDDQVVHWSITTDRRQSTAEAKAAEEENTPRSLERTRPHRSRALQSKGMLLLVSFSWRRGFSCLRINRFPI